MKIDYIRIIMFILIGIIIFNQIKITKMIMDKQELLDSDPLVYGAKRYNIDYCSCIIDPERTIEFTKNYSKTIIRRIADYNNANNLSFEIKNGDWVVSK